MKKKIHIMIDCGMVILLPFLMAYSLIGESAHEYLGVAMFLLFVVHHIMNAAWWRNLFRGKYSTVRIVMTVTNLLLAIIMVALPVSGIIMSRYAFSFLDLNTNTAYARTIHLLASYWGFVLMSFHVGLHGKMFLNMVRKTFHISKASKYRTLIFRIVAGRISSYGVYAFVHRQIENYMFLKIQFVFFDFTEPMYLFLLDYISIMFLFALLGYNVMRIFIKQQTSKLILA